MIQLRLSVIVFSLLLIVNKLYMEEENGNLNGSVVEIAFTPGWKTFIPWKIIINVNNGNYSINEVNSDVIINGVLFPKTIQILEKIISAVATNKNKIITSGDMTIDTSSLNIIIYNSMKMEIFRNKYVMTAKDLEGKGQDPMEFEMYKILRPLVNYHLYGHPDIMCAPLDAK